MSRLPTRRIPIPGISVVSGRIYGDARVMLRSAISTHGTVILCDVVFMFLCLGGCVRVCVCVWVWVCVCVCVCPCESSLNSSCVSVQDPDVKTLFDRISELRAQLLLQEDEVADATRSDDEFYEPDSEIAGPAAMEDHGSGEDAELGDATEDHHASEDVEFCDAMEDNDAGEDAELCDAPEDRDCGEDAGADGRDVVMDRHRSRLSTTSFEAPSEAGRIGEMVTEEMMGELPEGMDDEQAMELSVILQQIHDLELGFVSENVIVYAESALIG